MNFGTFGFADYKTITKKKITSVDDLEVGKCYRQGKGFYFRFVGIIILLRQGFIFQYITKKSCPVISDSFVYK
ncbi:hypothetical protein [Capnocytophaga canimorsus]|uniref:hypothetical protein n=1 Tax=Capnocytophaga canimorsus TaxID=28188 RepID=UPI001BB33CAC|nr:hypothetical protein [Capnocytophaga canimorsus]